MEIQIKELRNGNTNKGMENTNEGNTNKGMEIRMKEWKYE
jgi:hypothetical protein